MPHSNLPKPSFLQAHRSPLRFSLGVLAACTSLSLASSSAVASTTAEKWMVADFASRTANWSNIGSGTMTFPVQAAPHLAVMRLQNPAGSAVEVHRSFIVPSTDPYRGFGSVELDVNTNGATLNGGNQSVFGFDQSGWKYVSLSNYLQGGLNGWQHVTIPMSALIAAGLNQTADTGFLVIRIYHPNALTVDIDNIQFTNGPQCNFTQPVLPAVAIGKRWSIQSTDTMKWSKDKVEGQKSQTDINSLLATDAKLNVTHVALSTPYDAASAYSPPAVDGYKMKFVTAIRGQGFKVWHRQHWNAWEGDYSDHGFTKITSKTTPSRPLGTAPNVLNGTDTSSYLYLTYNYIKTHASEYAAGDIFTPVAEPENGGISTATTDQFNTRGDFRQFLRDSVTVCNEAFASIGLGGKLFIGFWGNSRYTAVNSLDERTVDGFTYLDVDHYQEDPTLMQSDLTTLWNDYGAPIIIGEWGNIWDSDPAANASRVDSIYAVFAGMPNIHGVNYWDDIGGSYESLLNSDFTVKPNGQVVASYFSDYETELLTVFGKSSDTHDIIADSHFSDGQGTILRADAVADYVTYTLPKVAAGTYDVRVGVKMLNTRGQFQLAASRTDNNTYGNIGPVQDEFDPGTGGVYTEFAVGTWSASSTSDKAFRFTVTGKNAASAGYSLCFDYITLIPH